MLPTIGPKNSFLLCGLDADADLSPKAAFLKSLGFGFVGTYLRKWLTTDSVTKLRAAGLRVGPLFWETSATRSLQGAPAGVVDAGLALKMMTALGVAPTTAVCFTVDTDVGPVNMQPVEDYFIAADSILWGHFQISGYADGSVISKLRADGLPYCVLAGAMGWSGSREFLLTNKPNVVQGPTVAVNQGRTWPSAGEIPGVDPIEWPGLDFAYDPEIALTADFGAW